MTTTSLSTVFHPGEILREEFLIPLGLKPYTLAKKLRIPRTRIERLVAQRTPVTKTQTPGASACQILRHHPRSSGEHAGSV